MVPALTCFCVKLGKDIPESSQSLTPSVLASLEALSYQPNMTPPGFTLQERPGIFLAGLDLMEMYGRNPAHYAEYWKAVQELWLRLYLSNLTLISAINVSALPPCTHPQFSGSPGPGDTLTFLVQQTQQRNSQRLDSWNEPYADAR